MANFVFKYFVRKNRRGWRWITELLDFANIFLSNIGEDQKSHW